MIFIIKQQYEQKQPRWALKERVKKLICSKVLNLNWTLPVDITRALGDMNMCYFKLSLDALLDVFYILKNFFNSSNLPYSFDLLM